jgi:Double zinc ribbon
MLRSGCGAENSTGQRFCNRCGAAIKLRWPKCGFDNPPNPKFCRECGASLTPRSMPPTTLPGPAGPTMRIALADLSAPPEGERKTVMGLFADIEGSMELEQDLDPEEARTMIAEIYNWFTEDCDTADLVDAKVRLKDLGG